MFYYISLIVYISAQTLSQMPRVITYINPTHYIKRALALRYTFQMAKDT